MIATMDILFTSVAILAGLVLVIVGVFSIAMLLFDDLV